MSKELELKLEQAVWDRTNSGRVKDLLEDEFHLTKWQMLGLRLFGKIFVNGEKAGLFDHVSVGDTLKVELSDEWSEEPVINKEPEILYEEDDFVIVNKPSGIPTNANKGYQGISVESLLSDYYAKKDENVALRALDSLGSTTSGVEIFAKNANAFEKLSELLKDGLLKKNYLGIVHGFFDEKEGVIDKPIKKVEGQLERVIADDGDPAVTNYEVLEERTLDGEPYSVLAINPDTRRSHQIRTHLKSIGHSLLGDELYGGKTTFIDRPALHGLFMKFISPFTNKEVSAKARLPWEFEDLLSNGTDVKTFKSWLTDDDTVLTKGLLTGGALAGAASLLGKGLNVDAPEVDVNLKGPKVDLPEVEVNVPKVELDAPEIDVDASLRELKEVADVEVDDVNLNVKKPIDEKLVAGAAAVGATGAALSGKVGDVIEGVKDQIGDIELPDVELPKVELPKVELPDVDLKAPKIDLPDVDLKAPKVDLPEVDVKAPEVDVKAPKVDLEAPKVNLDAPKVERVVGDSGKKSNWWKWLLPLLLLGLLALLGLRGCGNGAGSTATTDGGNGAKRSRDEIYESLNIDFDPSANVEYGKSWDLSSITRGHEGEVSVIQDIDPTKVGTQELIVRLTAKDDDGADVTRDFTQKVTIADTKAPEIKFGAPEIKLGVGDTFDPASNITVSDPVDGALKLGEAPTNGGFVVKSNVDTSKPGTYDVEVTAQDANGNESKDTFKVVVGDGAGAADSAGGSGSGTAGGSDASTSGSGDSAASGSSTDAQGNGTSLPNTLTSGN